MNFGTRLKELRIEKGLTQLQMADILETSKSNISKYESNTVEPNLDTIDRLADFFDVTIDYLLGKTDQRIADEDLSWRYPPVSNRFSNILINYRQSKGLSESNFAALLGISEDTYIGLETGKYTPSIELLNKIGKECEYSTDYLIGAVDTDFIPSKNMSQFGDETIPVYELSGNNFFKSRFEALYLKNGITDVNVEEQLGLTKKEFFDIKFNRMPTLSELIRISIGLNVSLDYLIGLTDIQIRNLSPEELELVLDYRDCAPQFQKYLLKKASDFLSENIASDSVAAEKVPLKEAK